MSLGAEISLGEPFCAVFQKNSGSEKFADKGVSRFSVEVFLSHSAENFRRGGIFLGFIKFGSRKNLDKRRGESRFSVEIFLSHSAEKFRSGNL